MSMRNFRILSKNYSSGKFVFCAGELVGKSACQRLRRGTFSTREKYPKARQKPYGFWTSFFVDKWDICRTWPKLCIVSPPAPLPLTV